MVSKCTNTMMLCFPLQLQLIIVAKSFTLVQNDSLNDELCISSRRAGDGGKLLRQQLKTSRFRTPHAQTGISPLIESTLNTNWATAYPLHVLTAKLFSDTHQHLFSITAWKLHFCTCKQKKSFEKTKVWREKQRKCMTRGAQSAKNSEPQLTQIRGKNKKKTAPLAERQGDLKHCH